MAILGYLVADESKKHLSFYLTSDVFIVGPRQITAIHAHMQIIIIGLRNQSLDEKRSNSQVKEEEVIHIFTAEYFTKQSNFQWSFLSPMFFFWPSPLRVP